MASVSSGPSLVPHPAIRGTATLGPPSSSATSASDTPRQAPRTTSSSRAPSGSPLYSQPNGAAPAVLLKPDSNRILPIADLYTSPQKAVGSPQSSSPSHLLPHLPSSTSGQSLSASGITDRRSKLDLPPLGEARQPPQRSSSLRRKPVPNYLDLPVIPSAHPFASAPASIRSTGSESPATPTTAKMEEDLFFVPPGRGGLLPPHGRALTPVSRSVTPVSEQPARNASPLGKQIKQSKQSRQVKQSKQVKQVKQDKEDTPEGREAIANETKADRGDMTAAAPLRLSAFHGGDNVPYMPSATSTATDTVDSFQTALTGPSTATLYADRPLPPLPLATPASKDISSPQDSLVTPPYSQKLGSGHAHAESSPSSSDGENADPVTPATTHFPIVPVQTIDSDTSPVPSLIPSLGNGNDIGVFGRHPQKVGGTGGTAARPSSSKSSKQSEKSAKSTLSGKKAKTVSNGDRRGSVDPDAQPEEDETFSVDRLPSKHRLIEAGTTFLRDEDGNLVCFGDLFPQHPEGPKLAKGGKQPEGAEGDIAGPSAEKPRQILKTIVFFIRHFWCGQCQDYTFASLSLLDPVAVAEAGIRVVIISNGSWKIIKAYRKLFNCPFPIYVDGPRKLYGLLGMTKMTNDFGPLAKGRAAYHQRPVPTQLLHGLGNAFFRMPLADPGKLTQLGGEFILAPGYTCEFAHRMTTTSDHIEAPDVFRVAGVDLPTKAEIADIKFAESQASELSRLQQEMSTWRENREEELDRIRRRKAARRGQVYKAPSRTTAFTAIGLDEELNEPNPAIRTMHTTDIPRIPEQRRELPLPAPDRPAHTVAKDEMDERFRRVMAMEQERQREQEAAKRVEMSTVGGRGGQ